MKKNQSFINEVQLISFNSILTGGGVSTYLEILQKHLGEKNKILTIAVRGNDKQNSKTMSYEYCLCAKTIFSEVYFIPFGSFLNLIRIIKKKNIFHFNPHTFTEIFLMFLTKFFRKKNVVTYHSNFSGRNRWSLEFFRQLVVCNSLPILSDRVVFITEDQFESVKRKVLLKRILEKKKVLISNFIESKNILESKRFDEKLKIIFVGRLTKDKGYFDLMNIIKDKDLNEISFHIVGKRTNDKVLKQNNVRYYNKIPNREVYKLYDKCSVLILPSYTESWGLVILEAMARGLVVLASDLPAIREYFHDGINGYLFPPGDTEKMKERILYLRNNPKEIEKISKNNLQNIKEFSAERQIGKYFNLYKELI